MSYPSGMLSRGGHRARGGRLAARGMAEELAKPVAERRPVTYPEFEGVDDGLFAL